MKVSDRQWQLFHQFWARDVGRDGYDKVKWKEVEAALIPGLNPETALRNGHAQHPSRSVEQRAARLAEVYKRCRTAASPTGSQQADHEIAMLLVKRELEAGNG